MTPSFGAPSLVVTDPKTTSDFLGCSSFALVFVW